MSIACTAKIVFITEASCANILIELSNTSSCRQRTIIIAFTASEPRPLPTEQVCSSWAHRLYFHIITAKASCLRWNNGVWKTCHAVRVGFSATFRVLFIAPLL